MANKQINGTVFYELREQANPTVLLTHGLELNNAVWHWQVSELAQHFRVLSFDLFSHGKSKVPPARPSLRLFANEARALMDYTGVENAVKIGFSLGGMIARRIAQHARDRANILMILNSPHLHKAAAQCAIIDRVAQAWAHGSGANVELALKRWITASISLENRKTIAFVRASILDKKNQAYHTIYQILAKGTDEITSPKPALNCTTLVITGNEDFANGPEMIGAIAKEIYGPEVQILTGLRHMVVTENLAALIQPNLEFLAAHNELAAQETEQWSEKGTGNA